jgi:hypothetical protein
MLRDSQPRSIRQPVPDHQPVSHPLSQALPFRRPVPILPPVPIRRPIPIVQPPPVQPSRGKTRALGPPINLVPTAPVGKGHTHPKQPPITFTSNPTPTSTSTSSSASSPDQIWTPTSYADSASTAFTTPDSAPPFNPTSTWIPSRVRPSPGLFLHSPPPLGQAFHTRYCDDDPDYLEELPLPPFLAETSPDIDHVWFLSYKNAEYVRAHFQLSAVEYPGKGAEGFWRYIGTDRYVQRLVNNLSKSTPRLPIHPRYT